MCLLLFALNNHPKYKLIMAANRDEFFKRPTLNANFWEENNSILGGRDIQSGGTWLGLDKKGRFIAITNYRDRINDRSNARSRGELSEIFLTQNLNVSAFLSDVSKSKDQYNGFNVLLSDDSFDTLYHYSNISDQTNKINVGIHGLSNHLLDTPWPKIHRE
ncbi:MAG: NRDE family protein [Cyclobacteriaceae bacterium]|nr:NRDE family protein [Cyclobacteriaceae bacterium]